jgi:hypothetical protein
MADFPPRFTRSDLKNWRICVNLACSGDSSSRVGWGVVLAVPTVVFSLYGEMNFQVMAELRWYFGYPFVVAGTAIVCLLLYEKLKRSDWH